MAGPELIEDDQSSSVQTVRVDAAVAAPVIRSEQEAKLVAAFKKKRVEITNEDGTGDRLRAK